MTVAGTAPTQTLAVPSTTKRMDDFYRLLIEDYRRLYIQSVRNVCDARRRLRTYDVDRDIQIRRLDRNLRDARLARQALNEMGAGTRERNRLPG